MPDGSEEKRSFSGTFVSVMPSLNNGRRWELPTPRTVEERRAEEALAEDQKESYGDKNESNELESRETCASARGARALICEEMKLVPDRLDAFLQFDDVVSIDGLIRSKTTEVVRSFNGDFERAKAIFEWVRDNIPHTKDIEGEVVTCSATEAFSEGTGICFPKSHLVASMMRAEGIPCGFCYQLFENDQSNDAESMALHGLNAVYLESTSRWHRIDPRGNREDIHGGFSLEREMLAFPEMQFMDDSVYASPLQLVVEGLQKASSIAGLWPNLPAIKNAEQD